MCIRDSCDGVIAVDEHCRTNVENVYAVGDCAETRQYAHLATRMGIVAADCATGHDAADDRAVVPECLYTHPPVAAVGLSEAAARARGEVNISRFSYRASGMAQATGQAEGFVKLIADVAGQTLLGAVVVGAGATDTIAELALAIRHGITVAQIAETIHAHPTFAEAVGETAEAMGGFGIHTLE